jgi:hypothetical protein
VLFGQPGTRSVSHDSDSGDWRPERRLSVDPSDMPVGRDKRRLHHWMLPTRAEGIWSGPDAARGARLRVAHMYQVFDAALSVGSAGQLPARRINRPRLRNAGGFEAAVDDEGWRVTHGGDATMALKGARSERRAGSAVAAQAMPCDCSWRSAAAARSAA